jgi:hypothetical protein
MAFDEASDGTTDRTLEEEGRSFIPLRWRGRAGLAAIGLFSLLVLLCGVLALIMLGIPIVLINGVVAGSMAEVQAGLRQLWQQAPLLLAVEFVAAWLLIFLAAVANGLLRKLGIRLHL